jgi:ligand-binding sensor domain-containing protein
MKKFLLLCLLMASISVAKAEKWKFYYPIQYANNAKLKFFKNDNILIEFYSNYGGSIFKNGYWQRIPRFKASKDYLISDTVNSIIWVVADSNKRILKYDLSMDKYTDSLEFKDSTLRNSQVSVDKSGKLWFFSLYKSSLDYLENNNLVKANFIPPEIDSVMEYFFIGPDNRKYIITKSTTYPSNSKILVYDGKEVKIFPNMIKYPTTISFDSKGNLYSTFGQDRKVLRFNGTSIDTITLKYIMYSQLNFDDQGRYFYKGKKDTLYVMSDTGTTVYHGKNNPFLKEYYTLTNDHKGKIWLASDVGLGEWDIPIEEKYKKEYAGLGNEYCLTFVETGEQQYLVSCFDRMTTINSDDRYNSTFYHNYGMEFNQILKDKRGDFWCINYNEHVYRKQKSSYIPLEYKGLLITAHQIQIGRDGNLLILRKNDILRYDGERFQQIIAPFDVKLNYWNCFLKEDSKGNIWVGKIGGGLFIFNGKDWKEYSMETMGNEAKKFFGAMDLDSNNHLWVSGYNGLNRWDGETWYNYPNPEDSMFHANAEEMAFDKKGKLWIISFNYGVGYFDGTKMIKYSYGNSPLVTNIGLHLKVASNNDKWFFLGFGIMVYNEQDDPIPPITPMSETISFYPNPTSKSITIQNLLADDRIQLFDLTGRKLIDYSPGKEGGEVMNLTSLNRGLYLMNVNRKNQAYFQAKVLKE